MLIGRRKKIYSALQHPTSRSVDFQIITKRAKENKMDVNQADLHRVQVWSSLCDVVLATHPDSLLFVIGEYKVNRIMVANRPTRYFHFITGHWVEEIKYTDGLMIAKQIKKFQENLVSGRLPEIQE